MILSNNSRVQPHSHLIAHKFNQTFLHLFWNVLRILVNFPLQDKVRQNRKARPRNDLIPPSITDAVPKDAHEMQFSDSDSDK